MSAGAWLAKPAALTGAVGLHAVLALAVVAPRADVETEGGAGTGAEQPRLGSSFADMAAGTLVPATPGDVITPETGAEVAPVVPDRVAQPIAPELAEAVQPRATPVPEAAAIAAPVAPSEALLPVVVAPIQPEVTPPERAEPVTAPDRLTAEPDAQTSSVTRSLRPKRRSAEFEKVNTPRVTPVQKKRKPKATARGNATRNATAGTSHGASQAKAAPSGSTADASSAAGNAAVSNYPGRVMRKISRVARPRVASKGTAVVSFSISGGGGLASVSVARSSGSAALDRAAVEMIRRAAPFPAPPPCAQRRVPISIKGR